MGCKLYCWLYFGSKNMKWHKHKNVFWRIWIINPLNIIEKQRVQAIRRGVRIVGGGPESLYLRAFPAPVPLDCIIIAFLHLPVIRSGELIVCVISHAFRSRCEVNNSA